LNKFPLIDLSRFKRKCPAPSRALFEFGGPGRNRTTGDKQFNMIFLCLY